jgi:septal ring factor EnvC (AmiA/AmiB activator)
VSVSARHLLGGPLIRRVVAAFFAASFATVLATVLAATGQAQTAADADPEETRARLEQLERDIARISREQRSREQERGVLQSKLRQSEEQLGSLRKAQARTRVAITDIRARSRRSGPRLASSRRHQRVSARQWRRRCAQHSRVAKTISCSCCLAKTTRSSWRACSPTTAIFWVPGQNCWTNTGSRCSRSRTCSCNLIAARTRSTPRVSNCRHRSASCWRRGKTRREVLTQIDKALQDSAATLAAREQDRTQLESLLEEIDRALAQLMPQESVEPFSAARGSMPWPVDGRITTRFGASRNLGKMRWQGVRMAAEPGSTVTAIHHGRVVYADWLRGSGLLLVIDHGDGYMSLYAHNESLLRDVGDWVTAGAPVSTVGDSGGQSEPGLYFEIRRNGKPTDPQQWCRS